MLHEIIVVVLWLAHLVEHLSECEVLLFPISFLLIPAISQHICEFDRLRLFDWHTVQLVLVLQEHPEGRSRLLVILKRY